MTASFTETTDEAEATSWLWLFGDTTDASVMAPPPHDYSTPGAYTVWLIASNGSGSTVATHTVTVGFPGASAVTAGAVTRSFDASNRRRQILTPVQVTGPGRTWLRLTSEETEEAIVFLRFLNSESAVASERRLSIAPGREARFDVAAYGLAGTYTLELASLYKFTASLEEQPPNREISLTPRRGPARTEDFRE